MCLSLTILHLCMKYESCTFKTTQFLVLELKCRQSSVMTLTFGSKMYRRLSSYPESSIKYESRTLKKIVLLTLSCWNQVLKKFKVQSDLDLWPFYPKTYRYIWPASMYEILKLYLENCSRYRVRTKVSTKFSCNLHLLTLKCIGIFLSASFVYVCNKKSVCWKLLKLSCQNQSADRQINGGTDRQTDKPNSYRAPT